MKGKRGRRRLTLISRMGANYFSGILGFGGVLSCIYPVCSQLSGFKIFSRKGDLGQRMS